MNNDPESEKPWPENLTPREIAIIQSEWEFMDAIADGTFKGDWLPISSNAAIPDIFDAMPELTVEEKE